MAVRVGFLGAGLIATFHSKMLRAAQRDEGVDVAWGRVFDPDAARADAFAAASGATACRCEEDVVDGCDAVYVCTWTAEHERLVGLACERGLPVFCEKPLSSDLAGAQRMAGLVAEAGVTKQVGLVLRRSPAFGLLKAVAEDVDAHGRPMAIVFRDDQFIPITGHYGSTWRGDVAKAGSGTLLEHSIHDLDMLEWVLGPITSVSAHTAGFHGIDGIEDDAAVVVRFASGALGTLVSVWHDVLERPSLRRVELFSERAHACLEGDWSGPVALHAAGAAEQRCAGPALAEQAAARGARLGNPDGEFVRAVERGEPAWPTFADALRAHLLADAVYRSAAAGGAPVGTAP